MKKSEDTIRRCIVCGEVKDKAQLLRFVATPDGKIVPDLYKKLGGKGVYVSNSYAALAQAIHKKLFAKALKKNVKADDELLLMVENVLHKNALNAISLAKKAGDAVLGLEKVSEAVKQGRCAFLLEALGSGDDGHKKIQHLAEGLPVYRLFGVEELDKALDKVNTVYLAFLKKGMSKMVKENFDKLSDFLRDKPQNSNGDENL